jgi:hypothetical protein
MRFAVLGTCQAEYVAQCIRFLAPGCEADPYVILATGASTSEFDKIAERLAAYDYLLAQPQFRENISARSVSARTLKRIIYYPGIYFTAYHPDIVYIARNTPGFGSVVKSPVGHYHSALAFLCYSLGLNVEQTVARFNEKIFARLGYLAKAFWTSSAQGLLDSGRDAQFPLEPYFRSWVRRGCFMYSVNHPKLFVLADLAAGALASCGMTTNPRLCDDYVPDNVKMGPVWPVYPEVAVRFGLDGSYRYKGVSAAERPGPYFDLKEFIQASFAIYRNYQLTEIVSPRIETWKADSGLVDFIIGDSVLSPVVASDSGFPMPTADGVTQGLPCETEGALCFLDSINFVPAASVQEVSIAFGDSTVFSGWAVDARSGTLAEGVDVVVDGIPYRATYGVTRHDVAQVYGNPTFESSGFRLSLAPGVLRRGVHSFAFRILAKDCRTCYEGPSGRLIID